MKKNIALVAGGNSGEKVISIKSASIVEQNIDADKYNIYKIILSGNDWYYQYNKTKRAYIDKNDFSLTINKEKIKFDCVFIIIHGTPGEDGKLQGYFDLLNIPYTTCDHTTSAITFNKSYCNRIVKTLGINVSNSVHLFKHATNCVDAVKNELKLPVFVKPNNGGSSIGMSKVKRWTGLDSALAKAFNEDDQVIVEEFIKGRELSCGMIKGKDGLIVFPLTEIKSEREYFDYKAKYKGASKEITPADVDEDISIKVKATASYLYNKLNCRGIVRFDFILQDDTNELYFLEVNTVPGQSAESIVPQQARAMGMTTKELYSLLIETTLIGN